MRRERKGNGRTTYSTDNLLTNKNKRRRRGRRGRTSGKHGTQQSTPTLNTSTETMEASFEFSSPIQIGRGRLTLIRIRTANTPGKSNLKLHVERMSEEQLEQALETIAEDPNNTTIIDNIIDNNNHTNKKENK